jgi:beta-galactosidase/beta-glucuronidase
MSGRAYKLIALAAVILATPAAGTVVVAGAMSTHARGESLVPPAAFGGPQGRLAVAGPWIRRDDPDDGGELAGYAAGTFPGELVTIPDVANAAQVTGAAGQANYRGGITWYRTTLTAPETGSYALRFESVHHAADVWLDGRLLGRHTGAYLPFEFALRLRAGVPHRLVVRADYRFPSRQKREGWHRTWFNYGGINREVTLRPLGRSELEAPTLRTRLSRGRALVDLSVLVRNRDERARDVRVRGTLRHRGAGPDVSFPAVHLGPGEQRRVDARVIVDRPALWAPGSPNLYLMHLEVPGESAWDDHVGLRELRREGGRVLLNGERLRLHGASLHEDVPERGDALLPGDMDALVRDLHAIGANATRAQHGLSRPLLERLDRAGILVWQGVGPVDAPGGWTSDDAQRGHVARERVRATVRQERLHPSVIAWNLVNEVAGNGHDATEVSYVQDLTRELHREDPGRLVAVDVWGASTPSR